MTTRRPLPILLAGLALAAGLVAGCGGDDGEEEAAVNTQAPRTVPQDTGGRAVEVKAKDIRFVPPAVTAKVGQRIEWVNEDSIPHTVTAERGAEFDSGNLDQGDTFEYTPREAGNIRYLCNIHPNQQGTITVTE